jgi:hypothetical protein
MQLPTVAEHELILWTAAGALLAGVGQLVYVSYRFGRTDERLAALKEDVRIIRAILDRYVKL